MTTGRGRLPIEVVLDTAEAERQLEELQQTAQAGVGEGSAGQPGLTAQVSGYGDAVRSTILPSIAAAAATIASVTALSRWVDSTIQASIAMGVATEGAVALRNSQLLLERGQAEANVTLLDSLGILDLWRERNERHSRTAGGVDGHPAGPRRVGVGTRLAAGARDTVLDTVQPALPSQIPATWC